MSASFSSIASDFVVPFQSRWFAPPRLISPVLKALSTFPLSAYLTSRAEDHSNSLRLRYAPVPQLRLGAFARSSVFLLECDRACRVLRDEPRSVPRSSASPRPPTGS